MIKYGLLLALICHDGVSRGRRSMMNGVTCCGRITRTDRRSLSATASITLQRRRTNPCAPLRYAEGLFLAKLISSPPLSIWIQVCASCVVAIIRPCRMDQRTGT